MYVNKGPPHYHYVPPPEPPPKKKKEKQSPRRKTHKFLFDWYSILDLIAEIGGYFVVIIVFLFIEYVFLEHPFRAVKASMREKIADAFRVRIVEKTPDEVPSPTPHVFGSNELTEMGRAILNGAVLYTPAPNGNPSRRYKAVFDVAYSIDPERSYGTIGNDLYFDFWVNGERVLRGEKIEIRAGETIEFKVAITEEDNRPDYGSSRVTFTVPNDVKRGKKYSAVKGVFVAEYGGNQYSHGCYETFIVEFSLSVKGKIRR